MASQLVKYKTLPLWTADSLPKGFREQHNTKAGTWAKLNIVQGALLYYALDETGAVQSTQRLSADTPTLFVEPQAWHRVEPASADLQFFLEFYCRPAQYYEKKYRVAAPHSEVVEVLNHIHSGDALDLGCGKGRNSIYLRQQGFQVTALDHSEPSLAKLKAVIAAEETFGGIRANWYDIHSAALEQDYDLIVSTVVLQFLRADRIPAVIENIQQRTRPGGINLIVAPISCDDFPCTIDWPFTFTENELKEYYRHWTLCKYNENPGTFHRLDESGNPHKARFATLVARNQ